MKYILNCLFLILIFATSAQSPAINRTNIEIYIPTPIMEEVDLTQKINDLSILHPAFRNRVVQFLYECKKQGIDLEVLETYRSPERQDMLRDMGYSLLSGGRSRHQHNIAVDVVPIKFGWHIWNDKKLWNTIGKIGEKQGLRWGGRWRTLYDPGHFEYPINIDSLHNLAIPDTLFIPLNYNV